MKTNIEDSSDVIDADDVEVLVTPTPAAPIRPYDVDDYYDTVAPLGYHDEEDRDR